MSLKTRSFILPSLLFLLPNLAFASPDPEALLRNMKPSWKKVKDFTGEMTKRELFGSKLSAEERIFIKFAKPFRVYIKYLTAPYKGREALYQGADWNNGEIRATNGSFPNITVNLKPLGSMAMKGQHHPITHIGFDYSIKNILGQLDLAKKNGDLGLKVLGTDSIDGRSCTRVEMTLNAKAGQEITPSKGDSWFSLAKTYNSDYYVLIHNNPKKSPSNPKNTIWVPTYYASKFELCIDDATGLPLKTSTWDHAGNLYEEYTFYKFQVNVGFTDVDFSEENSEYGF